MNNPYSFKFRKFSLRLNFKILVLFEETQKNYLFTNKQNYMNLIKLNVKALLGNPLALGNIKSLKIEFTRSFVQKYVIVLFFSVA